MDSADDERVATDRLDDAHQRHVRRRRVAQSGGERGHEVRWRGIGLECRGHCLKRVQEPKRLLRGVTVGWVASGRPWLVPQVVAPVAVAAGEAGHRHSAPIFCDRRGIVPRVSPAFTCSHRHHYDHSELA